MTTAQPTPEHILQRLDWHIIRRLDGLLQGDYRTLFYGAGLDFADLRQYQPQDDSRHIDWNVTARTNVPHVRQYVEDREITAWFLLDLTPSMAFGPLARPKHAVLIDCVATLARLLTRKGNRVGAILYTQKIAHTIPPKSGRNQVLRLTRHLLNTATQTHPNGGETDLSILLQAALNTFKKRSLVFVISDFFSSPGWERPLALLRQRHELVALRLWDPHEYTLPDAGFLVVEDAETGEQLTVDTSDPLFRRNFQAAAAERETMLRSQMQRVGVDLHAISTEEDLVRAIIRLAVLRQKRRRGRP